MTISVENVILSATEARERCDRVKDHVALVVEDVIALYEGQAWKALGYQSWAELCLVEFDGVQLAPPKRRELVREMHDAGLSVRAIASATSTTKSTVDRDIQVSRSGTPGQQVGEYQLLDLGVPLEERHAYRKFADATDEEFDASIAAAKEHGDLSQDNVVRELEVVTKKTTGTDGKNYPRGRKSDRVTGLTRRPPLEREVTRTVLDAQRLARRMEKLLEDDRLDANIRHVTHWAGDLQRLDQALGRLMERAGVAR